MKIKISILEITNLLPCMLNKLMKLLTCTDNWNRQNSILSKSTPIDLFPVQDLTRFM